MDTNTLIIVGLIVIVVLILIKCGSQKSHFAPQGRFGGKNFCGSGCDPNLGQACCSDGYGNCLCAPGPCLEQCTS